jgi:hypothetical protein
MKRISTILIAALAVPACSSSDTTPTGDDDGSGSGSGSGDQWDQELATREYDYSAALRIAALRLTGDLPTMTEINAVGTPTDLAAKKTAYEALVTDYMSRPTFARQMFYFWRDTFKLGETAEFDTAPALAAQLAATDGSYMGLLTQNANNCPTFDEGTGVFTPAECTGNAPKVGVLSNPGVMKQFYGNFAFRRVKWVQETFDCAKFPIELGGAPVEIGAASPFTGDWPFQSIAGTANGGRVNFLDVSAVICANCHTSINHIAPLFANFDKDGAYQPQIAVTTPLDGAPLAELADYLPAGETTAWRFGQPVADLPALGVAMAADPDVAKCGVARVWNWALGKTDIVDTLQEVPIETIQTQVDTFTGNGFKLKSLIFAVYTSDDFTKF